MTRELTLTLLQFVGLLNSVAVFPPERDLFLHEYNSSAAYSAATFTLVTTLVEAPFTLVANLVCPSFSEICPF
jgi:hypothetical protein